MITDEQLKHWFTYHPADVADAEAYERIRTAACYFAEVITANTPTCADQTVAVRKVREAVYTANAARACGGK